MRETLIDRRPIPAAITIPASTETDMDNCDLEALVRTSLAARGIDLDDLDPERRHVVIPGKDPDGSDTDRGAFNVLHCHDEDTPAAALFASLSRGYGVGMDYDPDHTGFRGAFVRSTGTAVDALVVLE